MATENSSAESAPQKRQRRLKQDPQFVFETVTTTDKTPVVNKQKTKIIQSVDDNTPGADLYEPGDVVWSKLGSFPWWPALIYRCDAEGGIYTRTLNSNNKSKRQFFVYFYGKYLEYSWLSTRSLLKYSGLNDFIQHAETAVQQASTKSEQVELANRYQLKVSVKKRVQWDDAIELADHALTMTRAERIQEFKNLLGGVGTIKKQSKNGMRRRRVSIDKNQDEATPNKRPARVSLSSSFSSEIPADTNTTGKPSEVPVALQTQNDTMPSRDDQQPMKKKRGRKPKTDLKMNETNIDTKNLSTLNPTTDHSITTRTEQFISSSNENKTSSSLKHTKKRTNNNEIEYDYAPSSHNQHISSPLSHLIQAKIPPLSNYEQKQIVEGLVHHPQDTSLTFDEAQTFAHNKAIEIVAENYQYRMDTISSEWFYDSILLKYPSIVFKYRLWFEHIKPEVIPNETDIINLKQWQIALMIQAKTYAEQQQSLNDKEIK